MNTNDIVFLLPKYKKLLIKAGITTVDTPTHDALLHIFTGCSVELIKAGTLVEYPHIAKVRAVLDTLKLRYDDGCWWGLRLRSKRLTVQPKRLLQEERIKRHEMEMVEKRLQREIKSAVMYEASTLEIDVYFINALVELETKETSLNFCLRDKRELKRKAMVDLLKANGRHNAITSDFNMVFDAMIEKAKKSWLWDVHFGNNK